MRTNANDRCATKYFEERGRGLLQAIYIVLMRNL
jgi:hypothetical protein